MKRLIFLLCFLSAGLSAQYVEKMDSVSVLPTDPLPLHKYIYQGGVYLFADGAWQIIATQSTTTYPVSSFGGETSIDTTNLLLTKQNANANFIKSNNPALTDARTPLAHNQAWATLTSTPTTTTGYGLPAYPTTLPASDVYSWAKASTKPTYTYTEVGAAQSTHAHAESEVTNLTTDLGNKQATLVSGTNIKTVNSNSLLGSGDIVISGSAAWGSITGTLSSQTDLNSALTGKEPALGNPSTNGYVLSSTTGGTRSWIAPGGGGGIDMTTIVDAMRAKPFLFTDFMGAAGATTTESATGWDYAVISTGSQAKVASDANHSGILSTTSSTTANSGGYCTTEANSFLIAGGETFEVIFSPRVASNTNTTMRLGFLDCTTYADAVDGCYFELPPASLALVGKTSSNSTRSTTSAIATLTVNGWYRLKAQVNSNATSVTYYLYDMAGGLLGSQSLTTNIPTASGRNCGAGVIATNSGTTATLLDYWDMMAVYYNDRALTR